KCGVPFTCEIIGSGPLRDELQDSIARLGLQENVRLRGQMPQAELGKHYRRAMVFALPCVVAKNGDRDILPNVLKEAMAVGVPVVTTRLGGIEELLTHEESGLLVTRVIRIRSPMRSGNCWLMPNCAGGLPFRLEKS